MKALSFFAHPVYQMQTISKIYVICQYSLYMLDVNKATGPHLILALLLKNCAANIGPSLCDLFNKSLSSGILPSEWKLAKITPIPKKSTFYDQYQYCL